MCIGWCDEYYKKTTGEFMKDSEDQEITRGTLDVGEPHPAAESAIKYLQGLGIEKLITHLSAFSSCAIENNRMAEVCAETLHRFTTGKPVSDRYLLGVAWIIRNCEET